jgi:hypothetical protein
MPQLGEIAPRHIWLAVFLSLLEVILFVVGRALESTYGVISGALVIFVLNLLFLLSFYVMRLGPG